MNIKRLGLNKKKLCLPHEKARQYYLFGCSMSCLGSSIFYGLIEMRKVNVCDK